MKSSIVIVLAVAVCSGCATVNPDWDVKPTAGAADVYYPPVATQLEIGGHVVVVCAVKTTGDLADCKVSEEKPLGFGFGRAALAMAAVQMKMTPKKVRDAPVEGGSVRIPLDFKLPPDSAPVAPPPLPPTDTERLTLANTFLREHRADAFAAVVSTQVFAQITSSAASADPRIAQLIVDAAREESVGGPKAFKAAMVAFYAATLDGPRLQVMIDEGRNGVASSGLSPDQQKALAERMDYQAELLNLAVRARVCAKTDCGPPARAPTVGAPGRR